MKMLKIGTFCLLAVLFGALTAAAQTSKVGFVNPQRIINESKIGRIAQEDLARLGREKDRRVSEALQEVEVIKQELSKGLLSVPKSRPGKSPASCRSGV